jgi:hypothetical protein
MDFRTRVERGKGVEDRIKEALAANGIKVTGATSGQDMYDKIDGFIDGKAIQIKYRDSGDDILYELVKPHDQTLSLQHNIKFNPGRDYRGKAVYYVVMTRDGKIYIIPVQHIKGALMQAASEFGNEPLSRPFRSSNGIEFRPLVDPRDKTRDGRPLTKVNAFIPPKIFNGVAQVIEVPKA